MSSEQLHCILGRMTLSRTATSLPQHSTCRSERGHVSRLATMTYQLRLADVRPDVEFAHERVRMVPKKVTPARGRSVRRFFSGPGISPVKIGSDESTPRARNGLGHYVQLSCNVRVRYLPEHLARPGRSMPGQGKYGVCSNRTCVPKQCLNLLTELGSLCHRLAADDLNKDS